MVGNVNCTIFSKNSVIKSFYIPIILRLSDCTLHSNIWRGILKKKVHNIRHKLNRLLKNDAVSSAMSLMLVLLIFFSATGAVLLWGPDYIKGEENKYQTRATISQYNSIVEVLNSLIAGGNGSSSTSDIVINDGSIEIDSTGERLIALYSNNEDEDWNFNVSGLEDDDSLFSIDGPNVDNVTIYWLEGTCFLAGTKITMADGSLKNIEDIEAGDVVRSYDDVSGSFVDSCVKKLLSYSKDRMTDYYVVINDELRVTPNHRLFVNDRWVEAGKLSVGDVLFDVADRKVSLFSVEKRFLKELSFDLLLESGNAYFADGFLVRSDVEKIIVPDNVGVSRMFCVPTQLSPLGAGGGQQPVGSGRTFTPTQDCYVSEWSSTSTGGCTQDFLRVDPGPATTRQRALLKFPLSQIPEDSFIEQVKLRLYYYQYVENDPVNNIVYAKEVDDYLWEDGDTSWRCWDQSEDDRWEWKPTPIPGYRCHQRTTDEYPELTPAGKIAQSVIPSSFGWVDFDEGGPGIGMAQSVRDFLNGDRLNYGWLINGESDDPLNAFDFYSSRATSDNPELIVHYITPPDVAHETVFETNVEETTATLNGYLDDAGAEYATLFKSTDCRFKYGLAGTGQSFWTDILAESRTTAGAFSKDISGFISGDCYGFYSWAENDAGQDNSWTWYFFTVPPPPGNLQANPIDSFSVSLSWNKATCGSEAYVYTKILARTDHFPADPEEDLVDPNTENWYNDTGISKTKGGLNPGTTYYVRAWTYAYEPAALEFWGRWSTQYVSDIVTTPPVDLPPTACFNYWDADGESGNLFYFDATCSSDDVGIVNYSWDFENDGRWDAFGINVSYDHGSTEAYVVRLRVRDTEGQYDYTTQNIDGPVACFDYWDADGGFSGTLMYFNGSCSYGVEGPITSYSWDFENDGSWDASGVNVSYDHGSDESYEVKLRVEETAGRYGYLTKYVFPGGPPTTPSNIEVIFNPSNLFNDISYEFNVGSTDREGDDIYYYFDWGDGVESRTWWGPYKANQTVNESGQLLPSHNWAVSGVYEITVQAINDDNADGDGDPTTNGSASDWAAPIAIRVYYQYVVPPDNSTSIRISDPGDPIDAGNNLVGAVCIHLFNDSYPSADDPARGEAPFGVIYVFDLGSIVHRIPSASGEFKTCLQSGGVMSVLPGGAYVDSFSNIYENGDILGFTVTMIRADNIIAGSGAGTYGLTFENQNTFTREQQGYNVYNFKVKFSGEYSSTWHEYLTSNFKFDSQTGQFSDFLVYDNYRGKQLIFTSALIKTDLV